MHGVFKLDLKHEKWPTKAILGTRQLKPGYGLPINPSQVISSLSRPVYEPPALEVLDMFESKEWEDEIEAWEKSIPDIEVRTRYVDLMMELATAVRYGEWVVQTGKKAIAMEDGEREIYYEGLLEALKVEVKDILGDVARSEREELPEGYVVAQKVIKLEEDMFILRPKTTETVDESGDETSRELGGIRDHSEPSNSNPMESTSQTADGRIGADAGYHSTMEGLLMLPKFSIQRFTASLTRGMERHEVAQRMASAASGDLD